MRIDIKCGIIYNIARKTNRRGERHDESGLSKQRTGGADDAVQLPPVGAAARNRFVHGSGHRVSERGVQPAVPAGRGKAAHQGHGEQLRQAEGDGPAHQQKIRPHPCGPAAGDLRPQAGAVRKGRGPAAGRGVGGAGAPGAV